MSKIKVFDEHGFRVELIENEDLDAELDDPFSVTIEGFVISKEQLHEYKALLSRFQFQKENNA